MPYQLTRHLEVAFDDNSGPFQNDKCLLYNQLTGTRLLGNDAVWEVLKTFESPQELGHNPIAKRAVGANILADLNERAEETPLLQQFLEVAKKHLHYRKLEPAEDVPGLIRQLDEVCVPLGEFTPPVHYMWADPKRLFRVMLDHFKAYEQEETGTPQVGPMVTNFARLSLGRPQRNGDFAQQLCTLSTSVRRAVKIWERYPKGAKILTLGDDDLMSLILTQRPGYEVDVFEIDRALVRFIRKRKTEAVRLFSRDLSTGLPEEFRDLYDVVLADPPYNTEGMDWFMECCADGLKKDESARLYLSTYPGLLENADHFFAQISKAGLEIESTHPYFNRYPFPKETYTITKDGLLELGYHPGLINVLMEVPYLYAHLYECCWNTP